MNALKLFIIGSVVIGGIVLVASGTAARVLAFERPWWLHYPVTLFLLLPVGFVLVRAGSWLFKLD